MAFSFVRIILEDTELDVYQRGLEYSHARGRVVIQSQKNNGCQVIVQGTKQYDIELGFKKTGAPRYRCSCPYFDQHRMPCKHIIASALAWDIERDVPLPDNEAVASLAIPPPAIRRSDITKAYADPLHADLEVLRKAADEMGRWSRPHSALPQRPRSCMRPFSNPMQGSRAIVELRNWSHRRDFDVYFCAGEMVAGFCEIIRWAKDGIVNLATDDQIKILSLFVDFNRELILEIIDDSEGLHEFNEAHVIDFCDTVIKNVKQPDLLPKLKNIRERITNY